MSGRRKRSAEQPDRPELSDEFWKSMEEIGRMGVRMGRGEVVDPLKLQELTRKVLSGILQEGAREYAGMPTPEARALSGLFAEGLRAMEEMWRNAPSLPPCRLPLERCPECGEMGVLVNTCHRCGWSEPAGEPKDYSGEWVGQLVIHVIVCWEGERIEWKWRTSLDLRIDGEGRVRGWAKTSIVPINLTMRGEGGLRVHLHHRPARTEVWGGVPYVLLRLYNPFEKMSVVSGKESLSILHTESEEIVTVGGRSFALALREPFYPLLPWALEMSREKRSIKLSFASSPWAAHTPSVSPDLIRGSLPGGFYEYRLEEGTLHPKSPLPLGRGPEGKEEGREEKGEEGEGKQGEPGEKPWHGGEEPGGEGLEEKERPREPGEEAWEFPPPQLPLPPPVQPSPRPPRKGPGREKPGRAGFSPPIEPPRSRLSRREPRRGRLSEARGSPPVQPPLRPPPARGPRPAAGSSARPHPIFLPIPIPIVRRREVGEEEKGEVRIYRTIGEVYLERRGEKSKIEAVPPQRSVRLMDGDKVITGREAYVVDLRDGLAGGFRSRVSIFPDSEVVFGISGGVIARAELRRGLFRIITGGTHVVTPTAELKNAGAFWIEISPDGTAVVGSEAFPIEVVHRKTGRSTFVPPNRQITITSEEVSGPQAFGGRLKEASVLMAKLETP